ncbi:alpha/beta fold hydrolase [Streptomyces sp900105245]|uniref:alpha/beta fold hydrolase n=1 Tax=Streptomyces sp. 900105245 TaxID=3154379 RepID=UPI00332584E7
MVLKHHVSVTRRRPPRPHSPSCLSRRSTSVQRPTPCRSSFMPAVLIHGVPDTHHVWDGVREHLTRSDVEAWDLPGFGSPRPENFHCTKEEYVSWLIERLEGIGEPVDLVGHDWGCLLTARGFRTAGPDPHVGRQQRSDQCRVRLASAGQAVAGPCRGRPLGRGVRRPCVRQGPDRQVPDPG